MSVSYHYCINCAEKVCKYLQESLAVTDFFAGTMDILEMFMSNL